MSVEPTAESIDEYRSRQRQRWSGAPPVPVGRTVTPPPAEVIPVIHSDPSLAPVSRLKKVHFLPVTSSVAESERVTAVVSYLKRRMDGEGEKTIQAGTSFMDESSGVRFVAVKTEPEIGGELTGDTDFFVSGPPAVLLQKLQLVALADPLESAETADSTADRLFRTVLAPYLQSRIRDDSSQLLPLFVGQTVSVGSDRFVATAAEPPLTGEQMAVADINTVTYVDVETSGDYTRIHVLPFQDTLPRVYDFDVFEDYLKPFFTMNPTAVYSVNTQFAFHGVQFKVVCVDPVDERRARRVGPNTVIHCEGLLHATLRNMLPAELLEQLSTLPPGLQMLLLNTELLASADVLDRFIDLQETLSARRGVSREVVESLPVEVFKKPTDDRARSDNATQCMICLSEFEDGESLRRLPCTHVFHQVCIDEWLLHRSTSCCLCKTDVDRSRAM